MAAALAANWVERSAQMTAVGMVALRAGKSGAHLVEAMAGQTVAWKGRMWAGHSVALSVD